MSAIRSTGCEPALDATTTTPAVKRTPTQLDFAGQAVDHAQRIALPMLRGDLEACVAQLDAANDDHARDAQRLVEAVRVVGIRLDALRKMLARQERVE